MMPTTKTSLPSASAVDVDLDGVGQIAVEQQRVLAEHGVDLPGLVVRVARLDVGGTSGQRAQQIIVETMICIARPPST
jgi:hypothetical protein